MMHKAQKNIIMKRNVFFLGYTWVLKSMVSYFILFLTFNVWAQTDLPNPPSDVQAIPAGSFIIPMDTEHQSTVPAGIAPFNLKAYGLINEFLQNGIPVKWAIASGKERDDIDFTATARKISPDASVASSINFRGGPFIVKDTSLPCGLSTTEIINAFGNDVAVYEATEDFTADIRYTLTHRPKIAVFNNGGNEHIHARILEAAGIQEYDVMDATDIGDLINCYTFVSEPHADPEQVSQEVIDGVKAFVLNGGNFLAQCHAIETYENRGFFHTTAGIEIINTDVSHTYPNADLAYSQIHGTTAENNGGSVDNWTLAEGSQWLPYTYPSIQHNETDTVIAMGAHLTDPGMPGGNVYYLGGHDYSRAPGPPSMNADLSTLEKVNALRLYLNAALVPSGNSNGAWANAGEPSLTVGCSDSVMLGCTLTGPPGSSFSWTPSTGLSCTDCPNPMARPEETTTYRVEVTNGCVATDTVQVIIGSSPTALFSNTTVCRGSATEFTDESTQSTFWMWDFGDPESGEENTSDLQNPSHTFSTDGEFDVRLITGTDSSCTDTIVKKVQVNQAPELKVNAPFICAGEEVTLTAEGAESYLWSNGESTASITITATETTSFTVTGTESNGCSSDTTTTVTVAPVINASVEGEGVSCFGENDGSAEAITANNNTYTYNWNSTPEQTTKNASGLSVGTYRLIVTDTIGCADTVFVDITGPDEMKLSTFGTDPDCFNEANGSATVNVEGGNPPYAYFWNTTPEQTLADANNLPAGTYWVTVTDSMGCTDSAEVLIDQPDRAEINTSTTDVKCYNGTDGSASVTVTGSATPYTFSWNTTPVQTNAEAINLVAGSYIVTITDANDCKDTATVLVSQPLPFSLETNIEDPTCVTLGKASVEVEGSTEPYTYSWNTTPTQNTTTATNLESGDYVFYVEDNNGCTDSAVVSLAEPINPVADFSFINECQGETMAFTDQSSVLSEDLSITSWSWDFGNTTSAGNISVKQNPIFSYDSAGIYNTMLIVTSTNGCRDSIVKQVEVYPIPQVYFGPAQEGCKPVCVSFKDSSTIASGSIEKWFWNFGDSNDPGNTSSSKNPLHCYKETGSYAVSLQVISEKGCSAIKTIDDMVNVYPAPEVDLGADKVLCPEDEENNSPPVFNAGPATKYIWQPTGETDRQIVAREPGTYSVKVTNEWGCESEASVNVDEVCPPRLFVPNAFSPDKDGINDVYKIQSVHVGKYQLLIFNRWGEIIFESKDKNYHWDGMYKGKPMPIGVYPWIIIYEGDEEPYLNEYKKEGSVTVVR